MLAVELAGRGGFAFHIIAEVSPADQYRVETQVDIRVLLQGVFAGESIDHELEVERGIGCLFLQIDRETEQPHGREYEFAFQQGQYLEACCYVVGFKQGFPFLVFQV